MQKAIPVAVILLVAALAAACHGYHDVSTAGPTAIITGSGRFISEARPVQGFTSIAAGAAIRVQVARTGTESLEITAEDNILPLVESVVAGDRLTLGLRPGVGSLEAHGIDVRVGVRELRGIGASGASRVEADGLQGATLRITLSGAAQFAGSGSVDRLDVDLSGASRMTAPALTARTATARLAGASSALFRVLESLTGSVDGVSLLEYLGDPAVQVSTSGASFVRRAGP